MREKHDKTAVLEDARQVTIRAARQLRQTFPHYANAMLGQLDSGGKMSNERWNRVKAVSSALLMLPGTAMSAGEKSARLPIIFNQHMFSACAQVYWGSLAEENLLAQIVDRSQELSKMLDELDTEWTTQSSRAE